MSKRRYISDSFWSHNWVEDLDPLEKYLYLYLLTNQLVSICWIYEIKAKRIAYETGIDKEMILKMILRFENAKKIYYDNWIICITNFVKNKNIKKIEDNLWKWIEREVKDLWKDKIALMLDYKDLTRTLENTYKDLSIPYLTLLNSTLLNSTPSEEEIYNKKVDIIDWDIEPWFNEKWELEEFSLVNIETNIFKTINNDDILEKYEITKKELEIEIELFTNYWKAIVRKWKNEDIWKELWDTKDTFEPNLRFWTWLRNNKKYFKKDLPANNWKWIRKI